MTVFAGDRLGVGIGAERFTAAGGGKPSKTWLKFRQSSGPKLTISHRSRAESRGASGYLETLRKNMSGDPRIQNRRQFL